MNLEQVFKLIETIRKRDLLYDKKNGELRELQGDFPTLVQMCDSEVLKGILDVLDSAIEDYCDLKDMARYYLYECQNMKNGGHDVKNWN